MTALMFIDVDLFKEINDSLGHAAGDQVLVELASRMSQTLRANDTVARFGGDEFVVLCEDVSSRNMASEIAERIRMTVAAPIQIGDQSLKVSISVGLAVADAGDDAEAVLRDADIAMYQAKSAGRGQVVPFESRMREELVTRLARERELRRALDLEQLEVYYQPIVSIRPFAIDGFEALVRWNHPELGVLEPAEFLELAERLGLIPTIDRFVLNTATEQAAVWSQVAGRPVGISVNAAGPTISDPLYLNSVSTIMQSGLMKPGQLTVEVTEQYVVEAKEAARVIPEIRRLNARVAIDDFGTGHSSFSQVAALTFDVLKIDHTLVESSKTPKGLQILRALMSMAETLGVETIAEGVESRADLDRVMEFSPDYVQGHSLGKAGPADQASALLAKMERV